MQYQAIIINTPPPPKGMGNWNSCYCLIEIADTFATVGCISIYRLKTWIYCLIISIYRLKIWVYCLIVSIYRLKDLL